MAVVSSCPVCKRSMPPMVDPLSSGWMALITQSSMKYFDRILCLHRWAGDEIAKEIGAEGT